MRIERNLAKKRHIQSRRFGARAPMTENGVSGIARCR